MIDSIQSRRTGAIVVSAALVAALAASALAVPVSAAKPKCMGKTATIVGTNRNEVIRGVVGTRRQAANGSLL